MALNTKEIKIGEGKLNKTITPGNTVAKIYDITLKPGYNADSFYVVLNIETEPIDDFEGFNIDLRDDSKGKHKGQVGRVRASQYAFESKTLPSGIDIDRDQSILRTLLTIATAQGKADELHSINADTIEDYIEKSKKVLCNNTFLNYCVAGKEYTNKEGYIAYDLYLPKMANKKYAFSADVDSVLKFNAESHILPDKKKEAITSFEPAKGNDFDLF